LHGYLLQIGNEDIGEAAKGSGLSGPIDVDDQSETAPAACRNLIRAVLSNRLLPCMVFSIACGSQSDFGLTTAL